MSSNARKAFDKNCADIERLLEVHKDIGGTDPGRRYGLEVLNKSSIVLITAFWEAYCEDIAAEALQHFVDYAPSADDLPTELKKRIAKDLKSEPHELTVWTLAGDGWRNIVRSRLQTMQADRNRRLNTPKTEPINDLFHQAVGIFKVSDAWYWSGMSREQAADKLDRYVSLRGDIAHRGAGSEAVRKVDVRAYYGHVKRLVGKTGGRVNKIVKKTTGHALI